MANRYIVHDETGKPVKGHELGDGLYSVWEAKRFIGNNEGKNWAISLNGQYVWPVARMFEAVNG